MIHFFGLILVLYGVLYISSFERKFIGLSNSRFSIYSSFYFSLFHSFTDFLKLSLKDSFIYGFIYSFVWMAILFFMSFVFILIMELSFMNLIFFFNHSIILFFFFYSLLMYMFVSINWCSMGIFSFITLFRTLIQMISYETILMFNFIIIVFIFEKTNFLNFKMMLIFSFFFLFSLILGFISELNRQPFDFLECESELISGFNIEFSSNLFSLIFLFEYSFLLMIFWILLNYQIFSFLFLSFFFVHVRSFFPRFRFDKMLNFFWKDMFILICSFFFLIIFLF